MTRQFNAIPGVVEPDVRAQLSTQAGAQLASPVPADAVSMFHVLDGSTLGGHVIGRQLAAAGINLDGRDLLGPYCGRAGGRATA